MVGLGCCCACCSEQTNTWTESFATTPVADGNPFDVVRNITGPGCRSYPMAGGATVKAKTSQVHINADGSTPLYLGQNGYPRGGKLIAGWGDDHTNISQTPKMQGWSLVVPDSKVLSNEMYVSIDSRAIMVFGGTQIELGLKITYRKKATLNTSTGGADYRYRADIEAYKKTGTDQRVVQASRTTDWLLGAIHIGVNFKFSFGATLFDNDCKSTYESRGYQTYILQCFDLLNPGFCPLPEASNLSFNNQTFACRLGWKTDVTWGVSSQSTGTGIYNFGSHYIRWYGAGWSPLP